MLNLTFKYKLKPTKAQVATFEQTLEVCRWLWNSALRERKDWCNSRKSRIDSCSLVGEYVIPADEPFPNYGIQSARLTQARKHDPRLRAINSQVLQQVLMGLDRAWDNGRKGKRGYPRFKKRYQIRSFVYPKLGKDPVKHSAIKLPQVGEVKWRMSRPIPEGFTIKQARVLKKASGYFVLLSLQADVNVPDVPFHWPAVGIDLGFRDFAATNEGERITRARFLNKFERKIKLLQRRLKNKKLRSNNRRKLSRKIARLHEHVAEARKCWHFELANQLCSEAGAIFVEDIDFRAWSRGMLAKSCHDAAFGQFVTILQWMCWKSDTYFAKVDKDYTSQICPDCSECTGRKPLTEIMHHCLNCGLIENRDVAAARVIRDRGILKALSAKPHERSTD